MNDRDEFFIGYAPPLPAGLARFVGRIVTGLVLGVVACAVVVASGHVPLEGGAFEFGHPQRFAGTIVERPYPALRLDETDGKSSATLLLVAPGKHGADDLIHGLDGHHVALTGARIRRGTLAMIEIEPTSLVSETVTEPVENVAGHDEDGAVASVTVRGEVVDSKCFLGVMVPGSGKTHKDCASLCLRGGVPPAVFVQDRAGASAVMLLADAAGEAVGRRVLHVVGEAVELTGNVRRSSGWLILRADPAALRTLDR